MEKLIEQVASQPLKAKWQQLYLRLGLEPRNRFQISVDHKDKKEGDKFRCCILDTIRLWMKTDTVARQNEREKMKVLLSALRTIQGFEAVALQLCETHGILLERQTETEHKIKPPQSRSGGSSTADTLKHPAPSSLHETHQAVIVHQLGAKSTATVHSGSDIVMTKQERRESDTLSLKAECSVPSAYSSPSQRVDLHNLESASPLIAADFVVSEQVEVESSSSFSATSERRDMLQVPIDMANPVHKFAILDVVQRIPSKHWDYFSSLLGLSKETVQALSKERATEEKYYNAVKEWLKIKRERATFAVLEDLLEQCSQRGAQIVMKKRLECNRDLLEAADL